MAKTGEAKNKMFLKLAGACGILGSVLPLLMVLLATFVSSWFSWNMNALSQLGVGEQATLFNSAMLVGGVLNFVFAVGLYNFLGSVRLVRAGAVSIMLSSISLALVGVFTVDYHIPHGIASFGYFMLAPAGFLLIAYGTLQVTIRKIGFTCGIAALLAILVLPAIVFALQFNVGFAVPELIEGLVISVWTIYMAAKLLRQQ